jgi:hypothetical protein
LELSETFLNAGAGEVFALETMIVVELGARYPSLPSALILVDPGGIDPLIVSGE